MVIALVAVGVFAASAAFAGTLLNEGFTYLAGNLVPNDGWVIYSGAGDIQVVSNAASGQMGVTASGADDHTPYAIRTTSQSTYACFDVTIPCATLVTPPLAGYFAGLNATATPTFMVARVYVLPITGGWTFGISNASTNTTAFGATPWGSTSLSCDVTYHIVIKYDPTTGTSTLWVNPVNEASASVSNTNNSAAAVAVNTFFLRQGAASSLFPAFPGTGLWKWTVDTVGVGPIWAEACYGSGPVAVAPTTWGAAKSLYR
jgi:hypothetical protein